DLHDDLRAGRSGRDRHEGVPRDAWLVSVRAACPLAHPSDRFGPAGIEEAAMLVKPEEVGLSSARLGRITDHLRRYIDAGKLSGALTLVARRGKVAYFEQLGHLEIERTRPVTPDSIFRIYSMTKP